VSPGGDVGRGRGEGKWLHSKEVHHYTRRRDGLKRGESQRQQVVQEIEIALSLLYTVYNTTQTCHQPYNNNNINTNQKKNS